MQRQRQSWDDLSLFQQIKIMEGFAVFPALTAMIFLRRNLGFRLLNPLSILGVSFAMLVVAEFANYTPYADALQLFAGAVFLGGLYERRRSERRAGQSHSYYLGDSLFESPSLPEFLRQNRRAARFVDPAICILAGWAASYLSPALAFWLIFSGLSLCVVEQAVYRRERERGLDTIDALIEADIQVVVVKDYSGTGDQYGGNATSIPTGLASDVQKHIDARQDKRGQARKAAHESPQSNPVQNTKPPLTPRQRLWRLFWGRHAWEWWQKRKER